MGCMMRYIGGHDAGALTADNTYQWIAGSKEHGMIRVVDDSGEEYLYPRDWFSVVEPGSDVSKVHSQND